MRGSWRDAPFEDAGTHDRLDPRALSVALDTLLPPAERTVAVDSGHFMGFRPCTCAYPIPPASCSRRASSRSGWGSRALGAAIARPDRLAVACLGDGDYSWRWASSRRSPALALPMLVVVYDDAAYGAEVRPLGPQGLPLERALPGHGLRRAGPGRGNAGPRHAIRTLGPVADWLGRRDGPFVLDAKISADFCANGRGGLRSDRRFQSLAELLAGVT